MLNLAAINDNAYYIQDPLFSFFFSSEFHGPNLEVYFMHK